MFIAVASHVPVKQKIETKVFYGLLHSVSTCAGTLISSFLFLVFILCLLGIQVGSFRS